VSVLPDFHLSLRVTLSGRRSLGEVATGLSIRSLLITLDSHDKLRESTPHAGVPSTLRGESRMPAGVIWARPSGRRRQ
jgi:hypothetical protein